MKLIDKKFVPNMRQYFFQCGLAFIIILIVLTLDNVFGNTTILASFGASTFIAFTMPKSYTSKPRNLIGGYIIATASGIILFHLCNLHFFNHLLIDKQLVNILFSAFSVGITSFIMIITDTEHPPAVGMTLGLMINSWDYLSILLTLLSVVLLSAIKELLKDKLSDLK